MAQIKQREIDRIYNALRPRLGRLGGGGGTVVVTIPPHTHSADQIGSNPGGDVAAVNVQAAIEEIAEEKLARDGSQTMLGNLDMDDNEVVNVWNLTLSGGIGSAIINLVRTITMTGAGLIEAIRKLDFTGSVVGEGVIDQPRVIHMAGDDDDGEALIDGLERTVFNDEPTKSVIENPSVIQFNPDVSQTVDQTPQPGAVGFDTLERTLVAGVQYEGMSFEPLVYQSALGYVVTRCLVYSEPV